MSPWPAERAAGQEPSSPRHGRPVRTETQNTGPRGDDSQQGGLDEGNCATITRKAANTGSLKKNSLHTNSTGKRESKLVTNVFFSWNAMHTSRSMKIYELCSMQSCSKNNGNDRYFDLKSDP